MSMSVEGKTGEFRVDVFTTERRGHDVDFWATRCTEKIVSVANTAPQPIRDQALAFKDQVREVIAYYMRQAIASDRTTVYNIVEEAGRPELIKDIRSG